MCELRGFSILKAELEPIEEEPDDCLSQYSRNGACRSQKNGTESNNPVNNTNRQQQESGQNSQTNTITSYATQYSTGFDTHHGSGYKTRPYLDIGGDIAMIGTDTMSTAVTMKNVDKWDHNYYFNDYGPPQDPFKLYQWSNSRNYGDVMRKQIKERTKEERRRRGGCFKFLCCCLHRR